MSRRKANVMLVNLTLRNIAAGKPSVNDGAFADAPSSQVGYVEIAGDMPVHHTAVCCQTNM